MLSRPDCSASPILQLEAKIPGLSYLQLAFLLPELSREEVEILHFLSLCLSHVDSRRRSYTELDQAQLLLSGGISISPAVYVREGEARPYLEISAKALDQDLPALIALISEILYESDFSDGERVEQLYRTHLAEAEIALMSQAEQVAQSRLCTYFSPWAVLADELYGYAAYLAMRDRAEQTVALGAELSALLSDLVAKLFAPERLELAYSGGAVDTVVSAIKEAFAAERGKRAQTRLNLSPYLPKVKNEEIAIPSELNYVAQGYNIAAHGASFSPALLIAKKVLETDYLWEQVRVAGEAYGCFVSLERSGDLAFVSYRDPQREETLRAYRGIPAYLSGLAQRYENLDKFIIASIAGLDRPLSVAEELMRAIRDLRSGDSSQFWQELRRALPAVQLAEVSALAPLFEALLEKDCSCILGPGSKL